MPRSTEGSQNRLERVYELYAPEAGRVAFLLTGDRELAEDIVHEAFVRLAGRFEHLRDPDALPFYLKRTIVNLARGHWRRAKVERRFLVGERSRHRRRDARFPDVETRSELRDALAELSERQRAAVVLRYYGDLSEHQTAEILELSPAAVRSLVHRGVEALRAQLRGGS